MCKNEIFIEEYEGFQIKFKWDKYHNTLFFDFSDIFNLLCIYEEEYFFKVRNMLIKYLIKIKRYENENYSDLLQNNFKEFFISLNSIMKLLESSENDDINDLKLWLINILFKYKKKNINVI